MKKIWIANTLGFIMLLLAGCKGEAEVFEVSESKQAVYFQFEYMNNAWGYQHNGWLIDSAGNVICYDKPENWFYADSLLLIMGAEVESNILAADSVCYTIDKEVLNKKLALINAASKGKVSEPRHEMYDAGTGVYSAFMYNPKDKVYRKVLLKQTGDFSIDNNSPQAAELYKWLESVNYTIQANK